MTRLEGIDMLKGIAILMIFLCHTGQLCSNYTIAEMTALGQMGCQLFFLISGYAVTRSWKYHQYGVMEFYKKRYLSIAPMYYGMILVWIAADYIKRYITGSGFSFFVKSHIPVNLLLLHGIFEQGNNDVVPGGWFIGCIVLFYLGFPLIIQWTDQFYKYNRNWIALLPVIVYIFSMAGNAFLDFVNPFFPVAILTGYESIVMQIVPIVCGMTLYYLSGADDLNSKRYPAYPELVALFLIVVYNYYTKQFGSNLLFWSVFYMLVYRKMFSAQHNLRFLVFLGRHSYAIFLVHILILNSIAPLLTRFVAWGRFAMLFFLAGIIILVSAVVYEKLVHYLVDRILALFSKPFVIRK